MSIHVDITDKSEKVSKLLSLVITGEAVYCATGEGHLSVPHSTMYAQLTRHSTNAVLMLVHHLQILPV